MTAANALPKVSVRELLVLAWPIVVSRSSQVIVGLSDALMIAHAGAAALAAVTTGAMNSFALFILPMGTVFIVQTFSAQYFGSGDPAGARRFGVYGLLIAALTLALSVVSLPLVGLALEPFEYSPDVRAHLHDYLVLRLPSAGAAVGMEALAAYYGGLGRTRTPMVANIAAMALNVLGNWLLIFGNLGLPALGVRGAALASSLATGTAFLGLLALFVWEARAPATGASRRLSVAEFLKTLRYGLPAGFNWFFEFLAFLFFVNVVVTGLGTTSLAALMAVVQLNSVAFMPTLALGSAGAIVVGQVIGAKAKDLVPRAVGLTFGLSAVWQVLVGALYLAWPSLIFAPFAKGETAQDLMGVGVQMLRLSTAWMLFDAAATTLAEALRGAGDTAFTLWARLLLAWFVFAPGSYLTVQALGGRETSAMLWLVAYLGLLAFTLWLRFRSGAWRRFELIENATP